jgi:two-component system, response regulator PdtaR
MQAARADNPLRIVVVEADSAFRLESIRALAADPGRVVVAEAADGSEMVERVTGCDADLVVFDLHLPVMTGLEALRRIREAKDLAAVVLTADASPESVRLAVDERVHGYLLKPFQSARDGLALEVAFARFTEEDRLRGEAERLQRTLESRKLIERAKGVLMKRYRWGEAEAFRRLQRAAMNRRTTMAELARQVLDGALVEL